MQPIHYITETSCDLWDILFDQLWKLFTIKVAYVGSCSNINVHTRITSDVDTGTLILRIQLGLDSRGYTKWDGG